MKYRQMQQKRYNENEIFWNLQGELGLNQNLSAEKFENRF